MPAPMPYLTGRAFNIPIYNHTLLSTWQAVYSIAIQYWETVSEDSRVSGEFKEIAKKNVRMLSLLIQT